MGGHTGLGEVVSGRDVAVVGVGGVGGDGVVGEVNVGDIVVGSPLHSTFTGNTHT